MHYADLTPDQKKQVAGKTPEEILTLSQEEGYELSDEELEDVAGGGSWTDLKCPACGSENLEHWIGSDKTTCRDCGANW